ncbi:unnamed protein product (macronuclear) [Paramecium tetraurelia]|uniref:EF-hand domain-containing protein n=1 Tax=Paramecium tetraurelia TaxID=5888 RepID=A0ED48_PARTE|nr:uncharacterized protein GSPATT00004084001 [Paramecium tetraurelia]CAK93215.1 unnamed protein product [Paramecium tetraurelia]|eukprot:XP_001460612.1 hypothetical protein (macronuclear) [Paramecium tetraurelia strain d4-2]
MSGIKTQTVQIVPKLRSGYQQENNLQEANKITKNVIEHYDARDLRLQDLQDCQKVYKVIKKETTTKWILLSKLDECRAQIKLELQYLKTLVIYVQNNRHGMNKQQQLELNQLQILLNIFETYVDQVENNTYDKKEKLKRLKSSEFDDKQKTINEWKKQINKNDILLDKMQPSISEWKQIPLKLLDEVLTSSYDLKLKLLQEPDSISSDRTLKYQNLIQELRKKLNLDQYKRSRNQFDEFQQIIDNFNYHIPKLQEMNQLNLAQLKEMKRKLKNKSKSNISQMNSTKSSPRKEESTLQQSEVDNYLQQYQKEKQRISRIDKAQYKQNIKESQREVFIAKNNQGSIQKLHQSFDINKLNTSKGHREYIISMIDGQLLKPYTPLVRLRKEDSRETCQNSHINETQSRKLSLRNASPQSFVDRISQKINDVTTCEEDDTYSKMEFPELHLSRQQGYISKQNHKFVKQQYNQKFIQKVNNNEVKLVKQCQDFYTTRMKFNDKFTQLVSTLHKDRPLTSSIRSRSFTANQNQRQEKIQKLRKVAEKARQNFFFRNKEQREWHQNLVHDFKLSDATTQYILEQLQYILEEGLFIQVDDIINMVQQIEESSEMKVTSKSCQLLNTIFNYFGIQISELNQHKKFKNFHSYID